LPAAAPISEAQRETFALLQAAKCPVIVARSVDEVAAGLAAQDVRLRARVGTNVRA
jgi:hypothetical protein